MDNYEWQKNKAVVDRMYYSERTLIVTTLFAGFFTATNLLYMNKGFFRDACAARIMPTLKWWAIINTVTIAMLLRPLTKDEMKLQWKKRVNMGKYLYTLYHMDPIVDENKE